MLLLELLRKIKSPNSTIGNIFIDDMAFCYTLELPWADNHVSDSCIPPGRYRISVLDSPHFKREVLHVHDVPNRENIEIHVGNYPHDTHGCILVGFSTENDKVGRSGEALDALIERVKDEDEETWLQISEVI